jgi:hypothetical protein
MAQIIYVSCIDVLDCQNEGGKFNLTIKVPIMGFSPSYTSFLIEGKIMANLQTFSFQRDLYLSNFRNITNDFMQM